MNIARIGESLSQKANDLIQNSKGWFEKKKDEGWEDTTFGLLSPKDIKEGGLVKDVEGIWVVPYEERIAEKSDASHHKGEKYIALPYQFLKWYRQKYEIPTLDEQIDNEIDKEIKRGQKYEEEKEFSIDDIPF